MSAIIDAYNDPYQELAICKARRVDMLDKSYNKPHKDKIQ